MNTTSGATSGTGAVYHTNAPEFIPGFVSWVRVTRSLVVCVCFVDRFLSFFLSSLCCLSFDLRIPITPLLSSTLLAHNSTRYKRPMQVMVFTRDQITNLFSKCSSWVWAYNGKTSTVLNHVQIIFVKEVICLVLSDLNSQDCKSIPFSKISEKYHVSLNLCMLNYVCMQHFLMQ